MQVGNKEVYARNVKLFLGSEGEGFNADIMVDGKKIAFARDAANGGPVDFDMNADVHTDQYREFKNIFDEIASELTTLPKIKISNLPPLNWDWDLLACQLVEEYEHSKNLKKIEKQITAKQVTAIVMGKPGTLSYSFVKYRIPIHVMLSQSKGRQTIIKCIRQYCTGDYQVLNKNIPKDVIEEALKK